MNHQVEQRTTPAGRYWVCLVCEWATDPTPYTDSTAAAAAIRHQLEHRTAGKDIPLVSLPWVRLDSNIASHDKTLKVLGMKGGKSAMLAYVFSLGWSGGQGTDGHIPRAVLPLLHATPNDARLLETAGLWDPDEDGNGWWIRNYERRQESRDITAAKREKARQAGLKSGCIRRGHPTGCTCWHTNIHPLPKRTQG